MTKKSNLTIDDIARNLGVSKTTVSRAISGKGRISADTRNKIIAYANKHHYRPSASAQGLAQRRTHNLLLVLPDADSSNIRHTMRSVWEEANNHGYSILLCYACSSGKTALLRTLDNRKADGVLLAVADAALEQLLTKRQIPFASAKSCGALIQKLQDNSESQSGQIR